MTTPAVPEVRNIRDLRRLWPEWVFEVRRWYVGNECYTEYVATRRHDYIWGRGATAAAAARALADRLIAAGYPPKEGKT